MNNNLLSILETFEKEKIKIRKKIDANKNTINILKNEIDSFFTDCTTLKDKVNAHKENKDIISGLELKLAIAYENETILYTALKVANEMKVKTVANAVRTEITSNPDKWCKYPLHYEKFKNMIKEFLSGTDLYFYKREYGESCYIYGNYDLNFDIYLFDAESGSITNKVVDGLRTKQEYPIIKASDILTECKKAFTARKKIILKYENMKKELDALRSPFTSCNAFYNILPYAPVSMQNHNYL